MNINLTLRAEAIMKHVVLAASLLLFLLVPVAETFAQDQSDLGLEEIVVTARKREESLLDTPISITAFSGEALDRVQIDRLDGIAQATPNLVFDSGSIFSGSNAAAAVFIRGVGQIDYTAEPGVGAGDVGRRGGRDRQRPRDEPQAGRHPGLQPQDDRGVRRRRARAEGWRARCRRSQVGRAGS